MWVYLLFYYSSTLVDPERSKFKEQVAKALVYFLGSAAGDVNVANMGISTVLVELNIIIFGVLYIIGRCYPRSRF
jgi:hypothetical protein